MIFLLLRVGYISEEGGAMVSSTILIGVHFSVHSRLPKCRKPHQLRKGTGKTKYMGGFRDEEENIDFYVGGRWR